MPIRAIQGIRIASWLVCVVLSLTCDLRAEDGQIHARLARIVNETNVNFSEFAPSFQAKVSEVRLNAITSKIRSKLGRVERVTGSGGKYLLWTKSHRIPTSYSENAEGKVIGLFFHPAQRLAKSVRELTDELDRLPGRVAYLVTKNGQPIAQKNEGTRLAVGSAFKLGVLAVLVDEIESGQRNWSDVAVLAEQHRSLPSGILQRFPAGSPITLHTLAILMISQSDNSATDLLIDIVSREAVSRKLGMDFTLTTREFFILKSDRTLADKFQNARNRADEGLLQDLRSQALPDVNQALHPLQDGIEWYVSLNQLCQLAEEVRGVDVMHVEPGLAEPSEWARIAYKGGSEIGVRNHTTIVEDEKENRYCIAATWNLHSNLEAGRFDELYSSLFPVLSR